MKHGDIELTDNHYHELTHTAHIMEVIFQGQILHHPVVRQTPELKAIAKKAQEAIREFHQAAGLVEAKGNGS